MAHSPERIACLAIVCLTGETVETHCLLGQEGRIVGVSGHAVRPPRVRREKPRVSAFKSADIPKIPALEPDPALAYSDLQAEIAAEPVRAVTPAHCFIQRDVADMLAMIRTLCAPTAAAAAEAPPVRPRVRFEEWDTPLVSGIRWVGEPIRITGGRDVSPGLSKGESARIRHRRAAGHHPRLLLRQDGSSREDRSPPRLVADPDRAKSTPSRDHVAPDPATGSRRPSRRIRRGPRRPISRSAVKGPLMPFRPFILAKTCSGGRALRARGADSPPPPQAKGARR